MIDNDWRERRIIEFLALEVRGLVVRRELRDGSAELYFPQPQHPDVLSFPQRGQRMNVSTLKDASTILVAGNGRNVLFGRLFCRSKRKTEPQVGGAISTKNSSHNRASWQSPHVSKRGSGERRNNGSDANDY
jgi:hypothetical protein